MFGTASAVEITARQAMLIELAGRESLPSAIALQTTAFNVGRLLGPTLAAPLMVVGNEGLVFLVNGASFIFVIIGLLFARTRYTVRKEAGEEKKGLVVEFREGLSYIRHHSVIASVILMATLFGFFGLPLLQQIPAIGRDVLSTAQDTEALIAARTSQLYIAQGAGSLVAALLAAYFSSARRKGMILLLGQVVFVSALIFLGFTRVPTLAFILFVFVGYGSVTQLVTMNMVIQMEVPNGLRGRVFAVYLWALQGVAPLGSLVVAGIAQNLGVPIAALASGITILIIAGGLHVLNPGIRRLGLSPDKSLA
jgi:MFS family permease